MTNKTSLNKSELSPTIQQASIKNGLILALFALVSTGLIAVVYSITKNRIASEVEAAMARRLNQIIPAEEYDNNLTEILNKSLPKSRKKSAREPTEKNIQNRNFRHHPRPTEVKEVSWTEGGR